MKKTKYIVGLKTGSSYQLRFKSSRTFMHILLYCWTIRMLNNKVEHAVKSLIRGEEKLAIFQKLPNKNCLDTGHLEAYL